MRYLGGKFRIAKEIASAVSPRGPWWEPFCGGLSVSVQLAKYGPGVISDACLPLISLYHAVRNGWAPPEALPREEWLRAKTLPDTHPLKAFAGFGCSFGGDWFHGYCAGGSRWINSRTRGRRGEWTHDNPARAAASAVRRDLSVLTDCSILCLSFFDVDPHSALVAPECIYADPPYAGTAGYGAVGPFSHDRFWSYCQAWASRGVRVFVSEYACPVPCELAWEKLHRDRIRASDGSQHLKIERLFRVLPVAKEKAA